MDINTDIVMDSSPPTMANSMFLTNKEQGDWAEEIILNAINEYNDEYFAHHYGRGNAIAAGEEGFKEFYSKYQNELNSIGKKPDVLIFRVSDFPDRNIDLEDDSHIKRAVAAIEVRSSSFLAQKYSSYMRDRQHDAIRNCKEIREEILADSEVSKVLQENKKEIYNLILNATDKTFCDLDFRHPGYYATKTKKRLSRLLHQLKNNIRVLQKRDYLSITPKLEDFALVNRWIQHYNVKHFYLQVFFDKAYIISFKRILQLISEDTNEGKIFSIERDTKNQMKTTIKINILISNEILGKIDMPDHESQMKEFKRGRLLFYVTFIGGKGYLDYDVFIRDVINA